MKLTTEPLGARTHRMVLWLYLHILIRVFKYIVGFLIIVFKDLGYGHGV